MRKIQPQTNQKSIKDNDDIIGRAYDQLKSITKSYAKKDLPVLFVGETGSGKELFARYFVQSSPRPRDKFQTVNCAGVTETLLESELFGHMKGAFTGAYAERKGKIETCNGGILFLDELGDASERFQAAILRVLEYKTYSKVGSDREIKNIDTLIIAATNKPRALRDDLKYRFRILPIPPLQKMDIPLLVQHFLGRLPKKEILDELMGREYPGNVRDLKLVCKTLILEKGDSIFGKRPGTAVDGWYFDYERFRRELDTWGKFIQPIIEKYELTEFKYQYYTWDDNWVVPDHPDSDFSKLLPAENLTNGPTKYFYNDRNMIKQYPCTMIDLIEWLTKGFNQEGGISSAELHKPKIPPNEILPLFKRYLREYNEKGVLPYLLKKMELNYELKSTQIKKPALTPLLDLPPKEANREFMRIYLQYHLEKNSNEFSQTAKSFGITEKSLRQKLDRLKISTD